MKNADLAVTGMTCGGCVAGVRHALGALAGVDAVDVSLAEQRVHVRYDENRVGIQAMRDALRSAGYDLAETTKPDRRRGGCCCS